LIKEDGTAVEKRTPSTNTGCNVLGFEFVLRLQIAPMVLIAWAKAAHGSSFKI
jgi:hypothetical protein